MHDTAKSTSVTTSVTATLSVRDLARAVEFYEEAFGAVQLHHGGVAQLSIDGADFWVADESPEHLNFSPETLGGVLGSYAPGRR